MHGQWKVHEQLFGKGKKRLDLLAQEASNFFSIVQQALLMDIQLTLSKLGDPGRSGKFENMTLEKLMEEIKDLDPHPVPEALKFHKKLEACLADFADKSTKVRERRNKYLAHLDYDVALDLRPEPLETPTRTEIEEALNSVDAFNVGRRTLFQRIEDSIQEYRNDSWWRRPCMDAQASNAL